MEKELRKNIKSRVIPLLLAFFLFLSFSMASVVFSESDKDTSSTKNSSNDNEDTTADKDSEKEYLYDPTGKTDPFRSFIAAREEQKEKKEKPKTYLETLELSQLDLIVIVVGKEGKWAMVRDSKGLGHVIKEGTAIGTNGGVVTNIGEGVVTIKEKYKDFRGNIQTKEIKKETPKLR